MAPIPHTTMKTAVVVNPLTGRQIPHVRSADPEKGVLVVMTVIPAPIPMQMIRDGVTESLPYTFVSTRDGLGNREPLTYSCNCCFDIVDLQTGLVLYEADGPQAPLRTTNPAQYIEDLVNGIAPIATQGMA